MTTAPNLRLTYMAIFITHDDEPEDRAAWHAATTADQNQAACSYHVNYGGDVPAWALRGPKGPHWEKTASGYTLTGHRLSATLGKVGRNVILTCSGQTVDLGRRATLDHADAAVQRIAEAQS